MTADLTPKAQQTRQHILDTALALFAAQGYDATTMREIAAAADCSLGLAYRYFARKEELVLALYERMAADTVAQINELAGETIAERFHAVMTARLAAAAPYRDAIGALFGATVNPASGVSVLGDDASLVRDRTAEAFARLVHDAADAPPRAQGDALAALLHSLHFALILFWLYDRSPGQRATGELLAFVRDMLALLRKVLPLPMVKSALLRVAGIMATVFAP